VKKAPSCQQSQTGDCHVRQKQNKIAMKYKVFNFCMLILKRSKAEDCTKHICLTPCSSVLLKKLIVTQLVKKFPAFYGTRSFITAFTRARQMYPVQTLNCFPKIHSNIILPSAPRSSELSLHFRLSNQNTVYICL